MIGMAHTLAESVRCEVPVLFASTEGQTALIAIRLAAVLHEHGLDSQAIDVSTPEAEAIDWSRVHGALVGASLHMGRHQKSAAHFVHEHAAHLNAVPSAFFSVSLAAASKNATKWPTLSASRGRSLPRTDGRRQPSCRCRRLAYREYNVFVRF
jgi:menaquinone-dependent protoporphyrinogen oxidase